MKNRGIIYVNLAVLLFGLAGLFAKWISLPAICITFGRVFFSSITLALWILTRKESFRLETGKDFLLFLAAGGILALHWWSFLASIQLATVAIGTITFSSFPLFVTFLEPLLFHQKLRPKDVLLALVILAGVYITIPAFSLENQMARGIAVGMFSAFSYAVLTLMNKRFTGRYSGTLTAFYEQGFACLVLAPRILYMAFRSGLSLTASDLGGLVLLGVITTALAHTLFISSLKQIPAQLAGICSSMETVYGILFAMLFLGEIPSLRECLGAFIIVGCVIYAQASK